MNGTSGAAATPVATPPATSAATRAARPPDMTLSAPRRVCSGHEHAVPSRPERRLAVVAPLPPPPNPAVACLLLIGTGRMAPRFAEVRRSFRAPDSCVTSAETGKRASMDVSDLRRLDRRAHTALVELESPARELVAADAAAGAARRYCWGAIVMHRDGTEECS